MPLPPEQSTLPITHTIHARLTQIIHAQVQKCTTHSAQQTLAQSLQHTTDNVTSNIFTNSMVVI